MNFSSQSTLSGALSAKSYYIAPPNGTLNLNNISLPNSGTTTVYVNGNVNINSNITYNQSPSSISGISLFKLIVQGNIIIQPGVSEIDGVYVATPTNSSNGIIYDCGSSVPTNNCNTKLTVNGSLEANQLKLWRTYGSIGIGAAETVNYNPTIWLNDLNSTNEQVDKIETLPPVL